MTRPGSAFVPQYGFDAPGIMLAMLGIGVGAMLAGIGLAAALPEGWRGIGLVPAIAGLVPLALGTVMVFYGHIGKIRMRDHMIGRIAWSGDEQVLDIGTGRGLLLIAAARRLTPRGRAVGIDIWRTEDLTDNSLEALARNVAAEGVGDRVALLTQDARRMSFPDASFDVVLSLYCLHNIEDKDEQRQACLDIARVLKPGGRVLIGDYVPTHAYAEAFRHAGLEVASSRRCFGLAFAPMWMVEASKRS